MSFSTESLKLIRILAAVLVITILALLICHVLFAWWEVAPDTYLVEVFDLGSEQNIPSWFASMLWLFLALLSLANFYAEKMQKPPPRFNWFWQVISTVFLYFSVDEIATIHEEFGQYLHDTSDPTSIAMQLGSPGSPWIMFYAPVFAIFGICFLLFLWNRFSKQRLLRVMLVSALALYAVSISFDYFQGTTDVEDAAHVRVVSEDIKELSLKTVIAEEIMEDLATTLLVLSLAYNLRRNLIKQERS